MEIVDVAVVGGGPAGSSAAREAAERVCQFYYLITRTPEGKLVVEVYLLKE